MSSTTYLTKEVLDSLTAPHIALNAQRPIDSFKELMSWTKSNFYNKLNKLESNVQLFVHNVIIIDNNFLSFAKENKITITPLYNDAFISWADKEKNEEFFAQGVFLIS